MRPLRIRSLLAAAAGFAALPIVGPLMLAMRSELEAALDRGDRAEAEADAASLRSDRDRKDLADTKSLYESSNRLVAAQMAKAKADIDGLKGIALAANDRAEQATLSQRATASALLKAQEKRDDLRKRLAAEIERDFQREQVLSGMRNDLGVVSGERDAARKERDELALRLAAAKAHDPVRDWPQPGVLEDDACGYCGNEHDERELGANGEGTDCLLCNECYLSDVINWDAIIKRLKARKALKSAATPPKSST